MTERDALRIRYADHAPVRKLIDLVTYCAEGVSIEFDRWSDRYTKGPGLYFVIVAGSSIDGYADPMGTNRWPVDESDSVGDDLDAFFETARTVSLENDGAVVVTVDGVIHEQMVRLKDLTPEDLAGRASRGDITYADWMGARHMSAADTSARADVIATITLSEESGRVTRFRDGEYVSYERDELGAKWRAEP